jgi:hypothetical protein
MHMADRSPRHGAWLPLVSAAAALALSSRAARAEHRADFGASLAVTASYDDNVFAVPDGRRRDVVSRLVPRVGAAFRSPRLALRARYARDVEDFRRHPELSTWSARQEGVLEADWSPGAGFALAGTASYAQTHTPGEFNVIEGLELTGLELRRSLARRLSTTQSLSRRLGARTRLVAEHALTRDDLAGGPSSAARLAAVRFERQVGPVDAVVVSYGRRWFSAEGQGTTSDALAVAWARAVTPRVHLEMKAGPRLSGGRLAPELGAAVRGRFRRGDAALSYVQTEAAIIGQSSPARAEGLSLTVNHSWRRSLTATVRPSLFRARGDGLEATVYGMGVDLVWRRGRHLSLAASQRLSLQRGTVGGRARGDIAHHTVLLTLTAGSVD